MNIHSGSNSPSHTAVVSCAYVITISLETAVFFSHPDFTVGFGILVYESPNQPFVTVIIVCTAAHGSRTLPPVGNSYLSDCFVR